MDGVSRWLLYSSVKFSITQWINRVALLCRNSVWLNVGFLVSIKTDNYNKFYSIFYLCWFQVMSLFGHTCTVPWLFLLLAILFCLSQQQYYLIVPVSTSPSSSVEIRLSKSIRYFVFHKSELHYHFAILRWIYRFRVIFSLLIVTGVSWITEVISFAVAGSALLWIFTDILNILTGVFVFVIFVMKPKIWQLLKLRLPFLYHLDRCCPSFMKRSGTVTRSFRSNPSSSAVNPTINSANHVLVKSAPNADEAWISILNAQQSRKTFD